MAAAMAATATTTSSAMSFASVEKDTYQVTPNSSAAYTVHSETFVSIPMDLSPGEMVFTDTSQTPLQMPDPGKTGYFITGFQGEIVDEVPI